jgi:hypothetical protein
MAICAASTVGYTDTIRNLTTPTLKPKSVNAPIVREMAAVTNPLKR